ncbi:unnamed protein product [Hymenolepis diminuta]|uniref:Protein SPT2 homolog n=1 Tax=Hymenolepis diminuta TaxID=6216 RepID=A0A0R3SEK2_HYMDI|nr:unnamed protein product [Hymenolepis diminuta]VUZ40317.1 unnamed protein product [Hymenolepis diminuta]
MSFKSFLELAQKNQDLNDNIVKKLSEEQKKKKELYLKERKVIEAVNKTRKPIESYVPPSFSSTKVEYVPSPVVDTSSKKPITAIKATQQRSGAEYVPTPIPKPKKLSSLMDALEEMNGEVSFAEKRFNIKTKIPKISGSNSSTSNVQKKLKSRPLSGISLSNSKVKSDSAVSSQPTPLNKDKLPSSSNTTKVLSKSGVANQQSICFKKIKSLSASKLAHKQSSSSSVKNHSNSSPAPSKAPVLLPSQTERHVRYTSKPTSTIQNHSSSRNSLQNKAPIRTEKYVPLPTTLHNRDLVKTVPSNSSCISPLKRAPSSSCSKPFPSSGLRTINSVRSPPTSSSSTLSKPSNPSRGIAAQYGLITTKTADSNGQFKIPPQRHPKITNKISKSHFTASKDVSLKRPAEASKRPVSQPSKYGIPQKQTIPNPARPFQPQISRLTQSSHNQPIVRGIAAQLGVLPQSARNVNNDLEDDSDEYESDDSFIDDSDYTSAKEYKIARNEIYKTLHFDPKKYAKVSKYDDLSSMESSYRQIEKEEKLSLRLGAQEDKEDMAWEEERRRRRMEKLKQHHKE